MFKVIAYVDISILKNKFMGSYIAYGTWLKSQKIINKIRGTEKTNFDLFSGRISPCEQTCMQYR